MEYEREDDIVHIEDNNRVIESTFLEEDADYSPTGAEQGLIANEGTVRIIFPQVHKLRQHQVNTHFFMDTCLDYHEVYSIGNSWMEQEY